MNFLTYLNRRLASAVAKSDIKEFRKVELVRRDLVASNKRRRGWKGGAK